MIAGAAALACAALFSAGVAAAQPIAAAEPPDAAPVVAVDGGRLRGSVSGDVAAFKGVPFAQPPVGDLRWTPPRPAAPWSDVRDASELAPDCQQAPFPLDLAPSRSGYSEDCLYLNVWAPARAQGKDRLPVMVWIHGGGFVNGGASAAMFDGSAFARDGVILISANYRLGRFGFFAHPALTAENPEGPLGNYAAMDMLAALEWVRRNIAAFGGDPGNVTVFGESSGGVAVQALLASPAARGLFARAISQSGVDGRSPSSRMFPASAPAGQMSGESIGLQIAQSLGVADPGLAGLAQLRAIPAQTLTGGLHMGTMGSVLWVPPMLDGEIIATPPGQAMRAGTAAAAPYMIGANSADAFFSSPDLNEAYAPVADRRAEAENLYDPDGTADAPGIGTLIRSDALQNEPARYFARLLAGQGRETYLYRFSYVAESQRDAAIGAAHGTDVAYVFDTVDALYGPETTAEDRRAAAVVHAYWVAFAKTGALAPENLPALAPYDPDRPQILEFTADGPVVGPDPAAARLDFVESFRAPD